MRTSPGCKILGAISSMRTSSFPYRTAAFIAPPIYGEKIHESGSIIYKPASLPLGTWSSEPLSLSSNHMRTLFHILHLGIAIIIYCSGTGAIVASTPSPTEEYPAHPDSQLQPGVPKGNLQKFSFSGSKIFPGTVHDYWLYVP